MKIERPYEQIQKASGEHVKSSGISFQGVSSFLEEHLKTTKNQQSRLDLEKRLVLSLAKEKEIWIDNLYALAFPLPGGGMEHTLAYKEGDRHLYKSNNLMLHGFSILKLFKSIEIHNTLFPETAYDLIGFTGLEGNQNRSPLIEPILRQPFVFEAQKLPESEIATFMTEIGFSNLGKGIFTNDEYLVKDLFPRNVLTVNGVVFVVDSVCRISLI